MSEVIELHDKLRKIKALLANPGTVGERKAAEAALKRVQATLAGLKGKNRRREFRVKLSNVHSGSLFVWLSQKYGVDVRFYRRKGRFTIVFRTSEHVERALWREFCELDAALFAHLKEQTKKFVREKPSERETPFGQPR